MTAPVRTVLVVGGTGGIGAATAHRFAHAGARVFLVARDATRLETALRALAAYAGVGGATADAADGDAMSAVVERCTRELGAPDILVNAAAVHGPIGPFVSADPGEWWSAVEVNLRGCVNACRLVAGGMVERGWGRIINFSGGGATAPRPGFSAYACAKAAIVRFTETLGEELRGSGVTVNAVAPGTVDTRLHDSVVSAGERAGADYATIRDIRAGRAAGVAPEVAAELVTWLASDAAAELTGKLISAVHDGWRSWSGDEVSALAAQPWLTLRRLDAHTVRPLAHAGGPA